jgi:hypothetical protein
VEFENSSGRIHVHETSQDNYEAFRNAMNEQQLIQCRNEVLNAFAKLHRAGKFVQNMLALVLCTLNGHATFSARFHRLSTTICTPLAHGRRLH